MRWFPLLVRQLGGECLLHSAIRRGDQFAADFLITRGASVNEVCVHRPAKCYGVYCMLPWLHTSTIILFVVKRGGGGGVRLILGGLVMVVPRSHRLL